MDKTIMEGLQDLANEKGFFLEESEVLSFLQDTNIIMPHFKTTEEINIKWKPSNNSEFYMIVKDAPIEILKNLGFGAWDTYNNIVEENIVDSESDYKFNIKRPVKKLIVDKLLLLFPYAWYDIIPQDFLVTDIFAVEHKFNNDCSNDTRFGFLSYGILK